MSARKDSAQLPAGRFETKDISFGTLLALIGGLLILLGGILLVTRFFDRMIARDLSLRNQPGSPLAQLHQTPPEPRLQADPAVDLIRMRDVEDVTLNHYAWIDASTGRVRIPIERAMAIIAERQKQHD